ncbi:hypothetical protein PR202_ga22820 [Eleusine coracana subsp. coracana]|uniref:Uncharacterized protein n=1 Tax=Eleusine coracana subsp. coracana TaxID=191504 RepID=A0AAV5D485_ELECO|nr:hypothetical protein PR202_ga22820 [Eleusine coracana subsp. coracana]
MELFMMTHTKNGEWTSEESREVYDNANNKITKRESRPYATAISDVEQNQTFQSANKETRSKSYKMHANGYLARYPTRKELLSEEYQRKVQQDASLVDAFRKLSERLEAQDAEWEEHRRQIEKMKKEREADREALKQAMSMMQAAQQRPSV